MKSVLRSGSKAVNILKENTGTEAIFKLREIIGFAINYNPWNFLWKY